MEEPTAETPRTTPDTATPPPSGATAPGATTAPAPPTDDLVTTTHTLGRGRKALSYTATTGRVVLREEVLEDGVFAGVKPRAEVFLTSYVVEPSGDRPRPVVFAFNGGPGSSSVWLHLGLLGPRRVLARDADGAPRPPHGLTDNTETLLAEADLVFVDPVSTGFSRAVEGGRPGEYHGFTGDVESVAEVIRLWTTRHDRWLSPKFLAGESYGTLRAAAVAEHLQTRRGMYLDGVVLVSTVLDLGSIGSEEPEDRSHVGFLPTYAAIAHHHGRHGSRALADVLAEAEAFVERDYPWALSRGDRLTPQERSAAVDTVARLTGLSPEYVDLSDLRVEHLHFFAELLRRERRVVGRLDGRFSGPAGNPVAEKADTDPSMDAIAGPYAAAWNHYVRAELGYESDLPYELLSQATHEAWSYKEFEGRSVDVTGRLARAMRANPDLRVHVAYGWYDGATPYFAARETFARMGLPPELSANIEHHYYPAGHMMYVHDESRRRQSADLAAFVRRASRT
ncbi:S10 family peptidase [Phycicoccus flavus]|uniref:S10 family peptidase n=1 Tax=Phycicoccus flavus TaxID=2502783 RepID=UPI000FEBE879|nr:peptidase S10 [Phycicoccus flavus]NHA66600.1 peptidase S10 [Phycicoccus flavus]